MSADPRMQHFHALTADQQAQAVRQLVARGYSEQDVSRATQLSVEFVRRIVFDTQPRS